MMLPIIPAKPMSYYAITSTFIKKSGAVRGSLFVGALLLATAASGAEKLDWPQFRGPNGCARVEKAGPVEFGSEKNVEWSTPMPAGHSSPCVGGNRVFLTGADREA